MFETNNPEVLLLYSYFAPHIRRLVCVFMPIKQDSRPEAFYDPALHSGSESISSISASKNSDSSETYLRQSQIRLSDSASNDRKPDNLTKTRDLQSSKIAVNEPLQSGRRHYVNLLMVATGETIDLLFQETR